LFVKNSYWKISKFDYTCGIFSILTLVLWYITKNPAIAIIFSILSDFLATVPTVIKAWKHPETETSIAYITGLVPTLTSFAAIEIWNFTSVAFPSYVVIIDIIIIVFIERKRFLKIDRSNK